MLYLLIAITIMCDIVIAAVVRRDNPLNVPPSPPILGKSETTIVVVGPGLYPV